MSNNTIIMYEGEGEPMVDVLAFAKLRNVDPRTVREWLRLGMIPAAQKDTRGKWHIPPNAIKLDHAPEPEPSTGLVPAPAVDAFPRRAEEILALDDTDTRPRPRAWFTVPEAGKILRISPYRIREDRDRFELVPWGPNGLLVVPAHVVRRYLGL
jgi:hypothetical protein